MGVFADMPAAEDRAKTLMANGSAIVAHAQRDKNGVISVRILRPCSLAGFAGTPTTDGMNPGGAWSVLTDDAEV